MEHKEIKKVDKYYYDTKSAPLGKGAFGSVFIAHPENKPDVNLAIKVIKNSYLQENETDNKLFQREIKILCQIEGSHIVKLIDARKSVNNIYIIMEFCNGGDLATRLKKDKKLSEKEALKIIKQIATAFLTLEDRKITDENDKKVFVMHRDIKPANILFHHGMVKVADFGLAKFVIEGEQEEKRAHTIKIGSPIYMSPQVIGGKKYSAKCDIWSTGVMLYEILFGEHPWKPTSVAAIYKTITTTPLVIKKGAISEEAADLLQGMLKVDEGERFSWKDVYDHPAMEKIEIIKDEHKEFIDKEKAHNEEKVESIEKDFEKLNIKSDK